MDDDAPRLMPIIKVNLGIFFRNNVYQVKWAEHSRTINMQKFYVISYTSSILRSYDQGILANSC